MLRTTRRIRCLLTFLALLTAGQLSAIVTPERSELGERQFRHPDLDISVSFRQPAELPAAAASQAAADLAALGVPVDRGRLDTRGGRWAAITPAQPLVPGSGLGNELSWEGLGQAPPADEAAWQAAAGRALRGYLEDNASALRLDLSEVAATGRVTVHQEGTVIQIHLPRVVDGIPVRGSHLTAVINHGNLVLFGADRWGDIEVGTVPRVPVEATWATVQAHVEPFPIAGAWGKSELILVPTARDLAISQVALGRGYAYRLAWAVRPSFAGEPGRYEALVDAHSGELISFADTNHYATARQVMGGVLPVSNDGAVPDGVEQAGWPMPFDDVATPGGTVTTDAGGNLPAPVDGNISSILSGQYIRMNDNCGAISLTSAGDLDFGASGGTDCVTPGFGGAGNTHASRTGFHELNRIAEMARGQLPANTWLQQQLTANMNINSTCNAFWNGVTVNFYRSGGGCSNTGELAGVFDHEWGHGMDANDATPGVSNPGEGIADVYTALRLNNSCIGRNFRPGIQCGGYGDPCIDCTGVRDIDFAQRASGLPHDFTWANATCGGSVHCRGYVYSEAVWDLWKRDLPALFAMDNNTALEVVTRLTYIAAGGVGTWYSGSPPFGGCSSSGGYLQYLGADDDNGNINDGTPHMSAIFAAFDRHEIACNTPAVVDSGCANTPTSAPFVTATPLDKSASLSWGAVTDATKYQVFRTDGVFACDFGKVKVGETTGTMFNDSGLQNGRAYSYVVLPIGASDTCMGPASSCATVTPAAGPNLAIDTGSASLAITGGDGDAYLDNCENGTMTFDVVNTGLGTLTNVRIVSVTPSNAGVTISTSFPSPISPSTLAEGATGSGSFSFTAGGLTPGETLTLQVEVTADELPTSKLADLVVGSTETDLTFTPSASYSFETGAEGWTTIQGTFVRSSSGGGADGAWYEQSSAFLDNQCDQIQSPVIVLSPTSTLSLWNNFDIEPQYINGVWYDRANVGVYDVVNATRTPVNPDGGRLYNASGPQGTCGTAGQGGWADAATTWGSSSWSAGALGSAGFAGQDIQLDIRYGTDASLNGYGFRFDQVTVTNVSFLGPDGQSDVCAGCTTDADCTDGLFCNGAETCVDGICQAGTPVVCDDGVVCTVDSCNEATDSCDSTPDDGACDNGLFCDGAETCDAVLDCQAGTPVDCNDGVGCTDDSCDETGDACVNTANDANCLDDGLFCNGTDFCDAVLDCQAGTPVDCNDGVGCTDDFCDETGDACVNTANDANCPDNGQFCDGTEFCDVVFDCLSTGDPCAAGQTCDEATDLCIECLPKKATCEVDADCCSNKCKGKLGSKTCK